MVSLAQPDFSMPYNVTCFTSTLLAIYFGSMLTLMLRRPKEMEAAAALAAKATKVKKLGKVAVVVVLFSALLLYLDKEVQRTVGDALGIDFETLLS